ncbi:MAG: MBL fold metallo-hydrolase [Pseudomonadales bacterium]|jgi:glyoxylase-like metal-dependent hydrolase (beta-lactamase superfamily II)|nr:MBL fold metallo-hydrolase [Pseudomonadales bacterium]MDP6470950.1 MBL fold metallo-hydrolase [Pseudomonadales bacterium]MDP6825865.1 MBL fold metallo-hydrolase [Pseudomonadales bacterium]MDP6972833.1 MBL fold metallo-hydrolase [Pseudomonadales bacterium]|tara:strand:- start:3679 stop:4554 length:876 start_codon:yes stop_codon:yes gene_type:complete
MLKPIATVITLLLPAFTHSAEDRFAGIEVQAQRVSGSVYMLTGAGGNIGVSIGDDGTLIIDDQYAPLAERILSTIVEIGGARPKIVLNTHYHGDHTGSNAFFGTAGTIIAHDNVRTRLLGGDGGDRAALPVVTYHDRVRVHYNDDEIDVIHLPHGHTDGDSVAWFRNANVIHLGDHFFNGRFPYIDLQGGGSVTGFTANLQTVLDMVPADVKIIPGHGPLADAEDLRENLGVIKATAAQVTRALDAGQNVDDIVAQGLAGDLEDWGSGFINEERWIRILHADHTAASSVRN